MTHLDFADKGSLLSKKKKRGSIGRGIFGLLLIACGGYLLSKPLLQDWLQSKVRPPASTEPASTAQLQQPPTVTTTVPPISTPIAGNEIKKEQAKQQKSKQSLANKETAIQSKHTTQKVTQANAAHHYDFYQLLAKKPSDMISVPSHETSMAKKPTYSIQVGWYQQKKNAQTQQLRLASRKILTHLQAIQADGETRYRLIMGPFSSLHRANQQQIALRQQHVSSVILSHVNTPISK